MDLITLGSTRLDFFFKCYENSIVLLLQHVLRSTVLRT